VNLIADPKRRDPRVILPAVLLFAGALMMCLPATRAAFHCDEANVFKHVTRFAHGEWFAPGRPGLLWLLLTPTLLLGHPTAIAIAMRLLAVSASVVTLVGVWRLATRPAADASGIHADDRGWGGVIALALLLTSMSWQAHSFEVRTDTFVLPLTLLAMHLLWRDRTTAKQAIAAGLAVGAAALFSQKTLYNGIGIGLGWVAFVSVAPIPWRWRQRARTAALSVGAAVLLIAAWYTLLAVVNDGPTVAQNFDKAANNAFDKLRPVRMNIGAIKVAARRAEPLYYGAALGLPIVMIRLRRHPRAFASAVVLATMLSTVAWHRGFFLYFIASFEPYAAIVAGAGLGAIGSTLHRRLPRVGPVLAALALAAGVGWGVNDNAVHWHWINHVDNDNQVAIQKEVRRLFPEPVPYWDSIGLIPGYPETTFFGTGAVRGRKRLLHGASMYVELAREKKPLFFIHDYMSRDRYLRPFEQKWRWKHYLPHRPNLYLRGGRVRVEANQERTLNVEIIQDGAYTVRFWGDWTGRAHVDGKSVVDGDVVQLKRGSVTLKARADRGGFGQLWILIGDGTKPSTTRPSELIDWSLYPRLGRERFQSYDSRKSSTSDLLTPKHDPRAVRNWPARRKRHRKAQQERERTLAQPPEASKKKKKKKRDPAKTP
jgi:hypothetical protein